jgi:hypothetical protein
VDRFFQELERLPVTFEPDLQENTQRTQVRPRKAFEVLLSFHDPVLERGYRAIKRVEVTRHFHVPTLTDRQRRVSTPA